VSSFKRASSPHPERCRVRIEDSLRSSGHIRVLRVSNAAIPSTWAFFDKTSSIRVFSAGPTGVAAIQVRFFPWLRTSGMVVARLGFATRMGLEPRTIFHQPTTASNYLCPCATETRVLPVSFDEPNLSLNRRISCFKQLSPGSTGLGRAPMRPRRSTCRRPE
jgi:hypothetical protein